MVCEINLFESLFSIGFCDSAWMIIGIRYRFPPPGSQFELFFFALATMLGMSDSFDPRMSIAQDETSCCS